MAHMHTQLDIDKLKHIKTSVCPSVCPSHSGSDYVDTMVGVPPLRGDLK